MEFIRIGYTALGLNLRDAASNLGVDLDVQLFAAGDQQQLIDLVTESVGFGGFEVLGQFLAALPLFAQLRLNVGVHLLELAAGDDVAVHLADDLFDDLDVRRVGRQAAVSIPVASSAAAPNV